MKNSKREVSKEKGMKREFNTIYGMDEGLKNSRPCVLLLNDASKWRMRDKTTLTGEKETEKATEEMQLKFEVN